jgi:membrane protein DedA with SNARE-associated domain
MTQLLDPLLTLLLNYGYPVVAFCVICGYIGIPIPSDAILLAAGSFTVDGTLNIFILIPLVVVTALAGDLMGYILGNKFGHLAGGKWTSKIGFTKDKISSVSSFLAKWGIWCVFLTRWLLTPLAVPVNLAAGLSNYSFKKFVLASVIGESIWAGTYIYLGYIFGSNWQLLTDYIDQAPLFLVLIVIGIGSLAIALRMWKKGRLF